MSAPQSDWLFGLSFLHPALIGVGLVLALIAFRAGLHMREFRRTKKPPPKGSLKKHMKLAQPAVIIIMVGFFLGPISSFWIREWTPMDTLHGWVGLVATILFATSGYLGLALKGKKSKNRKGHGALAVFALFLAAVAAVTGIELLP